MIESMVRESRSAWAACGSTALEPPPEIGSDRSFGVVFAAAFTVIALIPLLRGGAPRWWSLAVAGGWLAAALLKPEWLAAGNRIWFRVRTLLHAIVSHVVLALLYYAVVTPTGLIVRALGRDPLRLRRDPQAVSYWIRRDPPGPEPAAMRDQF